MSVQRGEGRGCVAVVGGGFSGLLTALHLLADPKGPKVRLFERGGSFGRGLAYATDNGDHVLNVPAGNMSAFPDDPQHFRRWLAARRPDAAAAFASRRVYGDYLQSLLREAVDGAFGVDRLLLEHDEVVDLRPEADGWRLECAMGQQIAVEAVVLAVGWLPPLAPQGAEPAVLSSRRYVDDPWRPQGLPETLGQDVLLLGSGLTMVDAALTLAWPGRRLVAISRRGLLPRAHARETPEVSGRVLTGSPAALLHKIRARSQRNDWRAMVDEVRGSVRTIWGSWSPAQRQSFLRHLRPWWDVHRHRMAPPVAARIDALLGDGELVVRAGAVQSLALEGERVRVAWRPRGRTRVREFLVDAVVNCTGGHADIRFSDPGLIRSLLTRDLLRPDALGLGVDVDAGSRPLRGAGEPTPGLYAVGPLTRGAFWEITSVPDIRRQSLAVARQIQGALDGADPDIASLSNGAAS
jgi:uncharacterized NAD(P)/FAD-binding protein YdhS